MHLNPLIQQREILAGEALVKLEGRAVIEITGADRLKWLHNMLSANILNLKPGQSAEALLLDAHGHIESLLHLIIDTDAVQLIVPSAAVADLFSWFAKTKFRSDVSWKDKSGEFTVIGSWGSAVTDLFWQDSWPNVVAGGYRYGAVSAEPWSWFENLVCADRLAELQGAHSFYAESAIDALRVAAHRPSWPELDGKTLPHELDLLTTAVHLSKGCYRGQETVAKVHNLGHPPRRLVLLHLDGSEHSLPLVGAEVLVGATSDLAAATVRGRVTTVGQHHELGPIALAVVSRSVPEDATLLVREGSGVVSANQEVIVPASAGKTVDRSRGPGLGLSGKKLL